MSLGTKTGLFNQMMSTRDELTPEFVEEASKEIQKKVLSLEEFRTSLRVGLYSCYKNEIRTETLFVEGDKNRKEMYYPAVDSEGGGLAYFRVKNLEELILSEDGFREPTANQSRLRDLNTLNTIIVPGVAFDIHGARLGFGKAFYDKCLEKFRGKRIALAYDFQIVSELPREFRARKLDWIVTEKRIIKC